jgi:3-hydroxybutyryl-CoA dehydrogenase
MSIKTVGVIGAGTMGNGIAQVCAAAGLKVTMQDIGEAQLVKRNLNVASKRYQPASIA